MSGEPIVDAVIILVSIVVALTLATLIAGGERHYRNHPRRRK